MTHTGDLINQQNGFTLIEMAMVLMIIGLLLGGLLVPLSVQMEQRNITDTQKSLSEIKEAIIGYAIVNGRLPCPASPSSNGMESFISGGNASNGQCSNFYDGFVPSATLGLSPVDSQGYAVDAWNNRIHYAVTSSNGDAFTTTNGMSTTGLSALNPDLLVCSSSAASGFNGSSCGTNNALTSNPGVPVVIFSTGKNGANSVGADETANLAGNRTFVSHSQVQNGFDDLVVWISPNILFNRMVTAGKLP